jgi:hypothetical protein
MKMNVLSAGLGSPHAGWAAIDELAIILARCFAAELLAPKALEPSWLRRVTNREKLQFEPLNSKGGDVLFVVARGPEDLAVIRSIPHARTQFAQIHAFVTDSYFQAGFVAECAEFDSITVTAHEDIAYPAKRFGMAVHHLYQGTDGLQWAPRTELHREIDIMAFGRTPGSYQAALTKCFHNMNSPYLYLHSPLGNLAGPTVGMERGMLFKLLHRSRISLAFHLMVEPQGNRPRSMMVTSRWLESLLSGCIVAGRRPVSRMADEMLNWHGATVEVPESPQETADFLQCLLSDNAALANQRRINIHNTLSQHDWRHRISSLCNLHGWEEPPLLKNEQAQLANLIGTWSN